MSVSIKNVDDGNDRNTFTGPDGGTWGPDHTLKNHKKIGFLGLTVPDPLKNHKATKPAFNVGPSSASHIMVVFKSSLPSSTKKVN